MAILFLPFKIRLSKSSEFIWVPNSNVWYSRPPCINLWIVKNIIFVCSEKKKKKRGGNNDSAQSTSTGNGNDKVNQLLAQHLLSVQIDMRAKKVGSVQLNFKYLSHLEVVVVNVKLVVDKESQVYAADKEVNSGGGA